MFIEGKRHLFRCLFLFGVLLACQAFKCHDFWCVLCWIYLVKTIGIGTSEAIPNSTALKPEDEPCTYQMPTL